MILLTRVCQCPICSYPASVDTEELPRGRKGAKSLSYNVGLLYWATIHYIACILPCHTSHSFAICLPGEKNFVEYKFIYYLLQLKLAKPHLKQLQQKAKILNSELPSSKSVSVTCK